MGKGIGAMLRAFDRRRGVFSRKKRQMGPKRSDVDRFGGMHGSG